MSKKTYVDNSDIHGKGLFAATTIEAGEIIGWLSGEPCFEDGSHVLWLSENEGFLVTCDLRYINHSDYPNACYYDDLSVVALRRIESKEEITHNYATADW